jgi:hypothetical protein
VAEHPQRRRRHIGPVQTVLLAVTADTDGARRTAPGNTSNTGTADNTSTSVSTSTSGNTSTSGSASTSGNTSYPGTADTTSHPTVDAAGGADAIAAARTNADAIAAARTNAVIDADLVAAAPGTPPEDAPVAAVVAAAAISTWLGAAGIRTRHVPQVRRAIDMTSSIAGTRPPALTTRGLA